MGRKQGGGGGLERKSWLRRLLGLGAVVLLTLVVTGWWIAGRANIPLPPAPELRGVRIDPPARPAASPFFMPGPRVPGSIGAKVRLPEASDQDEARAVVTLPALPRVLTKLRLLARERSSWLADPDLALRELGALRPTIDERRDELLRPGCMPLGAYGTESFLQLTVIRATHVAKLVAMRSVVRAQLGDVASAAADLAVVLERLEDLEQRCVPALAEVSVLSGAILAVHGAARWVVAAGDEGAALSALWRAMLAIESRPSPLPDAVRHEQRFIREAQLPQIGGVWPWYDRDETLELWRRHAQRSVWLAQADPRSDRLRQPPAEVSWRQQQLDQPGLYAALRYNHIGKLSLLPTDMVQYVGYWYAQRCVLAARRDAWSGALRETGRSLPASAPAAINPWKARPFDDVDRGSPNHGCDIPADLDGPSLSDGVVVLLPEPPAGPPR